MVPYSHALERTPSALLRITDCVQPAKYKERLSEDRFTLIEMVAHLADFEVIFLDRMVTAFETPGAKVEAYDEGKRAKEKHYADRDLHHELEVFENRRRETLDFLAKLSPEDYKKSFLHPERGEMTIADQVAMLLGHDLYHVEQAAQYLR